MGEDLESGLEHVSRDDPCRKGLRSRLGTARVVDEPFACSQFLEDLEVDVPGLSTGNCPSSFDDKDGDSTDSTLAGFLDLIFNRLDILVRIEIGDSLILTHQTRRLRDLGENIGVGDVLVVDDESLEEIGYDGLLEGLATLFPSSVGEAVSVVRVCENTTFANFETELSKPVLDLLLAGGGLLFAKRLRAVGSPVLGLARLDGWVEDVGAELDLEVEGIVRLGDLVDGAEYLFLADETEGAVL